MNKDIETINNKTNRSPSIADWIKQKKELWTRRQVI